MKPALDGHAQDSIGELLDAVVHLVEQQSTDILASVLLLDNGRLRHASAPSLPEAYNRAIDGMVVGPAVGSCGTAAFRGERVIVRDTLTDPLWAEFRELADAHGLRASWSTPIRGAEGRILGTFALYYREARGPTAEEIRLVDSAVPIVAAVIERYRGEEERRELVTNLRQVNARLQEQAAELKVQAEELQSTTNELHEANEGLAASEQQFRTLADAIPTLAWMARADGYIDLYNRRWYEYTGTTSEQMAGWGWQSVHDPAELPRVLERWRASIATGQPFEMEFPLRGADRVFRWFLTRIVPVKDAEGRVVRWFGTNTNVDEQRAVRQALRERQERLQAALYASGTGTFRWDIRTNVLDWDESLDRLFGLPAGETVRSLDVFIATVHPDDRARVIAACQRCAADGVDFDEEFRVVRPDGTVRWIDDKGKTFCDGDGRATYMTGACADVTERRTREETIEQRARLAALNADVGAALTQSEDMREMLQRCAEALVTHVGAAFARVWTLNAAEHMLELHASAGMYTHLDGPHGRVPVGKFKIGLIAEERQPHLTNAVIGDSRVHDQEWAKREGMVAFAGYPLVVQGDVVGVLAMFARHPLSEEDFGGLGAVAAGIALGVQRRRAEDAIQRRAAQLRGLTQASIAINTALSLDGILRLITEQAREIIGAHQAITSLTTDMNWAQAINAVSLSDKYAQHRSYDAPLDGSGIYAMVCEANRPTRMTQRQLEAHPRWRGFGKEASRHPPMRGWLAAPLVSRDGGNLGVMQLSDKYEGEFTNSDEAILVQLAQMASVAIENTRLFEAAERARAEAESANKAKSQFLAAMSHELRTPLNAIGGYTELLEIGVQGPLTETQRDYLRRIRESGKHLLGLINNVLNFAKLEAGRVEFRVDNVPLATSLNGIGALIEPQRRAKGLDVEYRPGDPNVVVRADREKLLQIVLNLLSNAVKGTDAGGRIVLTWDADEREACIRVADTGIGIAPEKLDAIFEPFVQVDQDPARRKEGTGLGLAISRDLARGMGGDLKVTSVLGEGSTFTLRLERVRQ